MPTSVNTYMSRLDLKDSPNANSVALAGNQKMGSAEPPPTPVSQPANREQTLLNNLASSSSSSSSRDRVYDVSDKRTPAPAPCAPEIDIPPELRDLLETPIPARISFTPSRFRVRDYPTNEQGVRRCISDNGFDETDERDVACAGIIVYLTKAKALEVNSFEPVPADPPKPVRDFRVNKLILSKCKFAANLLLCTSIFVLASDSVGEPGRWYRSFERVFGNFLGKGKFTDIITEILSAPVMETILDYYTISNFESAIKVLQCRLTRFSSPRLVMQAMDYIKDTPVINYIDPRALEPYVRFVNGGVAAEIAAGPLKIYCKGTIDPLSHTGVPLETKVRELMPIANPPYNAELLRQTKIILDVYEHEYGNWYQGRKAMATQTYKDAQFRVLVLTVKAAAKEKD